MHDISQLLVELKKCFENKSCSMKTRLDRIRIWMDRYVEQRKYAGSSFLLKHKGDEVFFHSSGLRNLEQDLPFRRDTLVRIYSMTKPVTSVALMMLAERGLFHLDAPLSDFLPEFKQMQALVPDAEKAGSNRGRGKPDPPSVADPYRRFQLSVQSRDPAGGDG